MQRGRPSGRPSLHQVKRDRRESSEGADAEGKQRVGELVSVRELSQVNALADTEQLDTSDRSVFGVVDAPLMVQVVAVMVRLVAQGDVERICFGIVVHTDGHPVPRFQSAAVMIAEVRRTVG